MKCKREVGWCPQCKLISDLATGGDGTFTCSTCSTVLTKCSNYARWNVCNRMVISAAGQGTQAQTSQGVFCDCCRFNRTIPDLNVRGNKERWYRL